MNKYSLSAQAVSDISDLYVFGLERFGRVQAVRFIEELRRIFRLLAENPRLGRLAPSIRSGVRRHEHRPYVVLYEETPDGVVILAVIHSSSLKRLDLTGHHS